MRNAKTIRANSLAEPYTSPTSLTPIAERRQTLRSEVTTITFKTNCSHHEANNPQIIFSSQTPKTGKKPLTTILATVSERLHIVSDGLVGSSQQHNRPASGVEFIGRMTKNQSLTPKSSDLPILVARPLLTWMGICTAWRLCNVAQSRSLGVIEKGK